MGSASIVAVTASPFDTPLHNPFVTSQGSAHTARAVAVQIALENGETARGESVPVTYVTGETIDSVLATCSAVAPQLVGIDPLHYQQAADIISSNTIGSPSARCGLEMALLAAFSAEQGMSIHRLLGSAFPSMQTDITIPIVPNAGELAQLAWAVGMRVFKIKVGDPDRDADWSRISAIRAAAPDAVLRIDANQAFEPQEAVDFARRLLETGALVELLEQPVRKEDFEGLDWVARNSPVPVFADESCRTPEDALKLVTATAVQGLNLKINKNGIFGVLDIIAIARAAGRRLMLGCMLETRYSIAVSLAIACGTGAFQHIDLDSHLLLDEPGTDKYFVQESANLILPNEG